MAGIFAPGLGEAARAFNFHDIEGQAASSFGQAQPKSSSAFAGFLGGLAPLLDQLGNPEQQPQQPPISFPQLPGGARGGTPFTETSIDAHPRQAISSLAQQITAADLLRLLGR